MSSATPPPWVELTAPRLGGMVLYANDEFFAPKEALLRAAVPAFDAARFTERGKEMDGWETRRRRVPGHDVAIVRLGLPGRVREVVVDTAHFRGNYPAFAAVDGAFLPDAAGPDEALGEEVAWHPLVPRSKLMGDTGNRFMVSLPWTCTHVRLRIYPDGGVARLRVRGEVAGDWRAVGPEPDVASLALGARVAWASDDFFGSAENMLVPGDATHMGDGWENRRHRGEGGDRVVVRLAAEAELTRAELDTRHFRGNAPGEVALDVAHLDGEPDDFDEVAWTEVLPRSGARPHAVRRVDLRRAGAATHARIRVYPDGGIARLRLFGALTPAAHAARGLATLNRWAPEHATARLLDACGATAFAEQLAAARPFASVDALLAQADAVWAGLAADDWLQAFAAHPRLGERAPAPAQSATAASWSGEEQAGASGADAEVLRELAAGNEAYFERFGYTFILCASGRTAAEMLAAVQQRLRNAPEAELVIAAEEQRRITALRLQRMVGA
jgi:allantoicase